jgi:predicted enzyme related to lactoylglutathione lyase
VARGAGGDREGRTSMLKRIVELMYFVPDREAAAGWYANLLDAPIVRPGAPGAFFIRAGPHQIWFHAADDKTPAGTAGQVAYWEVDDFDAALARAGGLGATLHRGPLDRRDGTFMCQVKDPFGNVIGLVGPRIGQGA